MTTIAIYSSKGGTGKTTLALNLAKAYAQDGKKTLLVDFTPQCDLTMNVLDMETWQKVLDFEEKFIYNFPHSMNLQGCTLEQLFNNNHFSIYGLLKPFEYGISNEGSQTCATLPMRLGDNLDFIPSSRHLPKFEMTLAKHWLGVTAKNSQSLTLMWSIKELLDTIKYKHGYDCIILDLPPSLGLLNMVILGTAADGFIAPCFSDYNSGRAVKMLIETTQKWNKDFEFINHCNPQMPQAHVNFMGYVSFDNFLHELLADIPLRNFFYSWGDVVAENEDFHNVIWKAFHEPTLVKKKPLKLWYN